jgi:Tfp pilus assembly protein PilE
LILNMKTGLTLVEIMVIVIIIAILASFAMPQYLKTQEKGLDNEAKANLILIQAAENLYITESGSFYGAAGATAHADLNEELDTNLPPAGGKWNYITKVTAEAGAVPEKVCAQATRNGYDDRSWYIMNVDNAPSVGACP